jgi:hypothetical protein
MAVLRGAHRPCGAHHAVGDLGGWTSKEIAAHHAVDHSKEEYVRPESDNFITTTRSRSSSAG